MSIHYILGGVTRVAKGGRLKTCWCRPTRVRIPDPAFETCSNENKSFLRWIKTKLYGWTF